jgi:hypothetical protein
MISPPITLWDSFGSPDILEYVEMKLPRSSQGRVPFTILLERTGPGSLEAEYKEDNSVLVG